MKAFLLNSTILKAFLQISIQLYPLCLNMLASDFTVMCKNYSYVLKYLDNFFLISSCTSSQ